MEIFEDRGVSGVAAQRHGLDAALKRWSHNGYGAEIVSSIDPSTPVSSLVSGRLEQVLRAMANAEGYRSPTLSEEIARAVADAPVVK